MVKNYTEKNIKPNKRLLNLLCNLFVGINEIKINEVKYINYVENIINLSFLLNEKNFEKMFFKYCEILQNNYLIGLNNYNVVPKILNIYFKNNYTIPENKFLSTIIKYIKINKESQMLSNNNSTILFFLEKAKDCNKISPNQWIDLIENSNLRGLTGSIFNAKNVADVYFENNDLHLPLNIINLLFDKLNTTKISKNSGLSAIKKYQKYIEEKQIFEEQKVLKKVIKETELKKEMKKFKI